MTLNEQTRTSIAASMQEYMKLHGFSTNAFAKKTGVNSRFISHMISKKEEVKDAWYVKVAGHINFEIKKNYWPLKKTDEFVEVVMAIKDAREMEVNKTVIGESGCGKTTAARQYCKKNPKFTYMITITSGHTKRVMYEDMCELLGLSMNGTALKKERRVAEALMSMRNNGDDPVLIIDESENLTQNTLKSLKSFYDRLEGHCPIVLLGTSQLIEKLEHLSARNKEGMPQFYSRFKAGITRLDPIDRNFSMFLADMKDRRLAELLRKTCSDYRELHDRVVYAKKVLDKRDEELTLENYKLIHNIRA